MPIINKDKDNNDILINNVVFMISVLIGLYYYDCLCQISQMLNMLSGLIADEKNLGEIISEILEISDFTDIQAFDKAKQAINKRPVLKTLGTKLLPLLQTKLKSPYEVVRQLSKKVQSFFFIFYSKPEEVWYLFLFH